MAKEDESVKLTRRIRKAVTTIDQGKSGVLCSVIPGARIFKKVVIMFIALSMEDAPDKWMANIARSIDIPCSEVDRGAYSTHPTPDPNCPLPPGASKLQTASEEPATYNQYDRLFIRGNAMSGAPIIKGIK